MLLLTCTPSSACQTDFAGREFLHALEAHKRALTVIEGNRRLANLPDLGALYANLLTAARNLRASAIPEEHKRSIIGSLGT